MNNRSIGAFYGTRHQQLQPHQHVKPRRTMNPIILFTLFLSCTGALFAEPPAGYTLTWSDEFEGEKLDLTKWNYRTDSRHWSTQSPTHVAVSNGTLQLGVSKGSLQGKNYIGSGVISKQRFTYGYYEARFRVPPGAGWHTSFWLMWHAEKGERVSKPARHQEIDICEQDSVNPRTYSLNLHDWEGKHKSYGHTLVKTDDLSASFHVWGCEFTASSIRYYFEGKLIKELDATLLNHGEQNIWLTSIASPLGGTKAVDETALPSAAVYDYVRFYEKKPAPQPSGNTPSTSK